jgi:hypothetical protein
MAERASISALSDAPIEKRVWHRGTLFNACIIGGVGFTAPGLWNAMNALGAGGAQEPFLINAANALVFGLSMWCLAVIKLKFSMGFALTCLLVGILCLFGGPIANRIGLRWTLMLGAVGYPLYSYVSEVQNMKYCYFGTDLYIVLPCTQIIVL